MEEQDKNSPRPRAAIVTFGCQMNVDDSRRMSAMLEGEGYRMVAEPRRADLVLLNTCSVRERAEGKVYSLLGVLSRLKRDRPGMIIGVAGCVAQQEGERLLKRAPALDFVLGADALDNLPALLGRAAAGRRCVDTKLVGGFPLAAPKPAGELSSFVTVMRGCDNFCSYCVVPYVRGRERSRPAAEVAQEAAAMVAAGSREIHLLGQNVNSYRCPETGGDFAALLALVGQTPGVERVRFTTSHPKDLSDSLIAAICDLPKVMECLHLPAQSGSNRILKAMNRGYTIEQYLEKIERLKSRLPGVAVGGDIIVGFPGESESDFQGSLALLRRVRYDFLFSFKYSDRPFTKAGKMKDKLKEEIKSERLARLQELQNDISLQLHRDLVGNLVEVLVEGPAKKGEGLVSGRDRCGRAVNFAGSPDLAGRVVQAEVTEGRVNSLLGRLVRRPEGDIK